MIFVALLVLPTGGENGKGDESDSEAEVEDGGVVPGLSDIAFDGRWTWEGGRGIGTRAEEMTDAPGGGANEEPVEDEARLCRGCA